MEMDGANDAAAAINEDWSGMEEDMFLLHLAPSRASRAWFCLIN